MKSMRPEDRPKAIGLSLGVVVIFGLIYMRLSAAMGGTPQPAPGAPASESIGSTGGTAGTPAPASSPGVTVGGPAPAPASKPAQIVVPPINPVIRNEDPFRSPAKTEISSDQSSGPVTKPAPQKNRPSRSRNGGGGTTAITEGDLNPTGSIGSGDGNTPALPTVGIVKPDEPPAISVTGIVDGGGGHSVAIIRVGNKQYVVSEGDLFGSGFKLVAAHPTTVVVTWSKERRVERKTLTIEFTASGPL